MTVLMMEDYDRWLSTAASLDELRAMLRPLEPNGGVRREPRR
jgi:putative SOS response-associated peptidase YedK